MDSSDDERWEDDLATPVRPTRAKGEATPVHAQKEWLLLIDNAHAVFSPSFSRSSGEDKPIVAMLPHPKTDVACMFMLTPTSILEIQRTSFTQQCSAFVDEAVLKDGAVHVCTPFDPLFFVLPYLKKNSGMFSPLSTILASCSSRELVTMLYRLLTPDLLAKLCDTSEEPGSDTLYRINDGKVVSWLQLKVTRMAETLCEQRRKRDIAFPSAAASFGGFSATSDDLPSPDTVSSLKTDSSFVVVVLQVLFEYIADCWMDSLTAALGVTADDLTPRKTVPVPIAANSEAESMYRLAQGIKRDRDESSPVEKKASTLTVAQRKLAKTDIKGMKTMASFFGKK